MPLQLGPQIEEHGTKWDLMHRAGAKLSRAQLELAKPSQPTGLGTRTKCLLEVIELGKGFVTKHHAAIADEERWF